MDSYKIPSSGDEFKLLVGFNDMSSSILRSYPTSNVGLIFERLKRDIDLNDADMMSYISFIRKNYPIPSKKVDRFEESFITLKKSFQKRYIESHSFNLALSNYFDSSIELEIEILNNFNKSLWTKLGEGDEEDIKVFTKISIAVEEIKIILQEIKVKLANMFKALEQLKGFRKGVIVSHLNTEYKNIEMTLQSMMEVLADIYDLCTNTYSPEKLKDFDEKVYKLIDFAHSNLSFMTFVEDIEAISNMPSELVPT